MAFQEYLAMAWFSVLVVIVSVIVRRTVLSPLAKVPGPGLAAMIGCYEMYYDLIQKARFPWKIQQLHKIYGSIVRLAPNELHINNVSYAEIHFASGSVKLNKYAPHQNQFGMPESTFNTIDASLYKLRRGALAPFFSKRNILALEPMLIQKVESTCQWLEKHKRSNAPIDLRLLFSCMTTDIITEYAFPHCFDLLSTADLSPAWRNTFAKGLRNFQWFGHFPSLWSLLRSIPDHVLLKMSPEMAVTQEWERGNQKLVREIVETYDPNDMPSDHLTIFHELLSSDLPEHEKSYERLWQEGSALIGAGVETTSNTLNVILYHLSQNPTQLDQLKAELLETMPNPSKLAPLSKLETLPYLTAVINEGLRLALGTTSRLIRVAPNSKLQYKDFVFPPGTTVSMSIIGFHHDAKTFPDPLSFVPEPWLEKSSHAALYVFGRGPRMCAGVNLAYAELYLTLAAIVRRFELTLFDTTYMDIEPFYDAVIPLPREDSKGVRVIVT